MRGSCGLTWRKSHSAKVLNQGRPCTIASPAVVLGCGGIFFAGPVEAPLKAESSMTWSRAFPEHFVLADGKIIKTLYEAGLLVLALPERHRANGHWQGAMQLLVPPGRRPIRRSAGPRVAAVLDRSTCGRLGPNPRAPGGAER